MSAASALDTIPTKSTPDAGWIAWYDILPFSQKDNNLLFLRAWKVRGSHAANTVSLRKHLSDNGLSLSSDDVIGELADFEHSALDTIGTVFKVGGTTMIIFYGAGIVFVGAILWRILTPESVGIIAGTAVKTAV